MYFWRFAITLNYILIGEKIHTYNDVRSKVRNNKITNLERVSELVAHDVVENRIDGRGEVVKDPGDVCEDGVGLQKQTGLW